jgi:DNA primase
MKDVKTILISEYLKRKNIPFIERNGELVAKCVFNNCDQDSNVPEGHLYFNMETGQYHCKKCSSQGNIFTLAEHLGDEKSAVLLNPGTQGPGGKKNRIELSNLVSQCHDRLPDRVRQYLNARGITNALIERHRIGFGKFYRSEWITLPLKDTEGKYAYLKLRRDPSKESGPKYCCSSAKVEALLFGLDSLQGRNDFAVICEGEFDCLVLHAQGIPAVTSTAGAGTFKDDWIKHLEGFSKIIVCYDRDEPGRKGTEKLIETLAAKLPSAGIYRVDFPENMTEGKDVTDYFVSYGGTADEFLNILPKYAAGKTPVDITKFKELDAGDITKILGLTIKKDDDNKLVTFLCMLSAYTEDSQFNISFNAPSSTGKSYIPLEIGKLFPAKDVMPLGYCSPTAFFHESGAYDKEKDTFLIDLSRKIIIFMDQPHMQLLERLRPILSHDKKEIETKITDKTQKSGLRAKKVIIRGFPAVVFCSAGMRIDEQEATRFILLSPETTGEKIGAAIHEKFMKEANSEKYYQNLENDPERQLFKERILAIKEAQIREIRIPNQKLLEERFLKSKKRLKPRHSRDAGRLASLVKSFALFNLWFRKQENGILIAEDRDIFEASILWEMISESQEHNLPPFIFSIFKEVMLEAFNEKNGNASFEDAAGLSRKEIAQKYYDKHGQMLADWVLRQEVIPMLETAGLIYQEEDPNYKRKKLIFPMAPKEQNTIVSQARGVF